MSSSHSVTALLSRWSKGDQQVIEHLMPVVYQQLHRIARRYWNGQRPGHILQPTALIHEAYLKLAGDEPQAFENRAHFFAVASIAMRQVLVNHAEARLAAKRGHGMVTVPLDEAQSLVLKDAQDVLDLHEALKRLGELDPRKSHVVELRYFGGLTIEETAQVLGISSVTVTREWQAARAWLARELAPRA